MDALNHLIISFAASPWVYLVVLGLVIVDGFFPPLPSESVIVALAAIGIATGAPSVIVLVAVAAAGSVIGDNIAFGIGRRVGTDRFGWMRRPKASRIVDRARIQLDRRATTLIIVARFVPVGRVAVNVVAGATGFNRRRFFLLTVVSGVTWAIYGVFIGVFVGEWVHHNAIVGAVIAIAIALSLGVGIDAVASRASRLAPSEDPRAPASVRTANLEIDAR